MPSHTKPASGGAPLPPINFAALADALLARAGTLVPMWLPGGVQRGHEYQCASLSGGHGSSCSVNLTNGRWSDFATDEKGGDLVSLYAAINGLDNGRAAVEVARQEGLEDVAGVQPARAGSPGEPPRPPRPAPPPAAPKTDAESWATVSPVPEMAPPVNFVHHYRALDTIQHVAEYRADGDLFGYVVRFATSDGGKETIPRTWCVSERTGTAKWHWRTWDEPRPLFLPSHQWPVPERTVVLVEGEKKAEALQALLDAGAPGVYQVASWPGGCKAWHKARWDWLKGCSVLLWPDCDAKRVKLTKAEKLACGDDELALSVAQQGKPLLPALEQPGMAAMLGIGALLRDEQGCTVQLLAIPEPGAVADGWDCADAINTDGWDYSRVAAFFATAYALPLPADETLATDAGGGGNGKKIDGLADAEGADGEGDEGDGWKTIRGKRCPPWLVPFWDKDKQRWLVSRKLVIAALTHDDALGQVLALNELSNNIEARLDWPFLHGKAGPITNATDLLLGNYLSQTYGLPSINRAALMEAIETVAHARPFHPIRELLAALEHDGTSRIDKWLVHVLGESPDTLPPPLLEYLQLVGRFWLLGMVNRVMHPGCKFDYCPVLEGPGGLGKSTLVEMLAGSPYFSDTHFDVARGKEGQEQVQGLWLYEIAELANFGKAEIGLIKAFITAKVDRYRPSYGRTVEAYARQCLLVGTTNESTYLRDRTGNRRFWPIPVRARINFAWIAKYRDQLLAEAYALYLQGAQYTPSPADEARLFVPMQESRLVETAVLSELLSVLTRSPTVAGIGAVVNELADFVTLSELTLALGVDAAKSNAALEQQIRSWLDHEGWSREKTMLKGVRRWGYRRPKNWPARDALPASNSDPMLPGAADPSTPDNKDADDAPF